MTSTRRLLPSLRALSTKASPAPPSAAAKPQCTPLQRALARRIRFNGPITVADYMRECLTHPSHGYYTTRERVLGARGDFITAPEVSQVFGELLGLWAASAAAPPRAPYRLIELGPGSGRLMRDALRALRAIGRPPARVDLVEASPVLRRAQRAALRGAGAPVHWHASLDAALRACAAAAPVVLAQEFLDALPVHVLHAAPAGGGWRERVVDVDREDDALRFALAPHPTPAAAAAAALLARWGAPPPRAGDVAELALEAVAVVERVAAAVAERGGAALFVDYARRDGRFFAPGNSLRAVRRHQIVPVLSAPGECDLTADVNFAHVRHAVQALRLPVRVHGPVSQRRLLLALGAAHRFRQLALTVVEDERASDAEKDSMLEALQMNYERLTGAAEMGEIYQAVAITAEGADVPDGFLHAG